METQLVWAPDPTEGYALGRVVDIGAGNIATVQLETNHKLGNKPNNKSGLIEVPIDNVFPTEVDLKKQYDDNCSLMYLNEANLLHNLRLRYCKDNIYTYVANILIALNPYHNLKSQLYSTQVLKSYQGKSFGKMPPHVFAVADKAFHDMKRMTQSQSIIVSGESGAGKTETTKYILSYLCESWSGTQHEGGAVQIEQLILEANPLLEAFGNAKTARNNNSSRFGKFIEIYFDRKFTVAGGHISHYLLEKSRICGQISGAERNYHIFYQLCVGLPEDIWHKLRLASPDKFHYLQKGCTRYFLSREENGTLKAGRKSKQHQAEGLLSDSIVNDLAGYNAMDCALNHFGVSTKDKYSLYQIVAGILHLGNIQFEESSDSRGGCRLKQDDSNLAALKNASDLLSVDVDQLQQCLLSRVMQTNKGGYKGSIYMVPLKVHEASNARDALAKAIYSRLFDYIVMKIINRALPLSLQRQQSDAMAGSDYSIGVLDIAGFEYFQTNSFEQFCINYCNEKMQNFFNERILNDEQQLYQNEALGIRQIEYVDNRDCIELFESKGSGIFDLLDEECRLPKPLPQHFTETVHQANKGKFRLDIPRKSKLRIHRELRDDEGFMIRHFAGAVCYQTSQFIEKNNDTLHTNLAFLMIESDNQMLKELFKSNLSGSGNGSPTSSLSSATSATKFISSNSLADKSVRLSAESVGGKFRKQLADLIAKLESTGTHFIRCIKPNLNMVPQSFDGACILSQLKCSGMTSVLELMQYGYPSRATYSHIHELYSPFLTKRLASLNPRQFCRALVRALGLTEESDIRFGVTKVFFRPGRFAEFDLLMKNDQKTLDQLVQRVQKWLIAERWKRIQWCTLSTIKLKNKIEYRRQCIITIQKNVRMYLVRQRYRPRYLARVQLNKMQHHLPQLKQLAEKLRQESERNLFYQKLIEINQTINKLRDEQSNDDRNNMWMSSKVSKAKIDCLLDDVRRRIDLLVAELQAKLSEQERLQRVQEELEKERKIREEEEARIREQEEMRRRKAELEERKRLERLAAEEAEAKKAAAAAASVAAAKAAAAVSAAAASAQTTNNASNANNLSDFDDLAEVRRRQAEVLKRLEQEKRDYELAVRLAQDGGNGLQLNEDFYGNNMAINKPAEVRQVATSGKKYVLDSWNYAKLRDTINTSSDIELLEACREEFHRRLKVYHQWKYRNNYNRLKQNNDNQRHNNNFNPMNGINHGNGNDHSGGGGGTDMTNSNRAPESVMNPFYTESINNQEQTFHKQGNPFVDSGTQNAGGRRNSKREQRYFRLPFAGKSGDQKGLWYAHFDGKWIARQMEIHQEKLPILLIAGHDDLQMCELSLEETGLTKKPGVEILPEEFESEWCRNGGKPLPAILTEL